MPFRTLLFLCLISTSALAQRNQISIIGSLHRYNSDFFLNSKMKNAGQTLSAGGNYKFSGGLALDMGYTKDKVYNFLFRAEYALRSYSTQVDVTSTTIQPTSEYVGHYLDISMGFKRMKPISDESKVGFGLSAGAGVPWFTAKFESRRKGGATGILEQSLPFAEIDFTLKNYLEKNGDEGWAMDYSFFARAYFTPAYERSEDQDPTPPYLAFGITLKVGHVKY